MCINNILSARAVMGLTHVSEGEFLKRTAPVALLMMVLVEAIGLVFTLGNVMPDAPMAVEP